MKDVKDPRDEPVTVGFPDWSIWFFNRRTSVACFVVEILCGFEHAGVPHCGEIGQHAA